MAFPVPNLLFLLDHHSQQYSPFGLEFSILYPKTEYYFALLVISVVLIKMACDFFFFFEKSTFPIIDQILSYFSFEQTK